MRVLVTGGAGYVGGFTARHLIARGHDVIALDDLSEGHRQALPDPVLQVGNIDDVNLVRGLLRDHGTEVVLHFAASTYVGVSVTDPRAYWRNNVARSLSLLESVLDAGVRRVVFSSTCATYGETATMPLTEDATLAPASPYAFTKLAIEQMIRDFSRAYGLRFALLRYFNAAGAALDGSHGEDHRPETHLIPLILQTALGRREGLRVFGDDYPTEDGTCVRDYVHVEDLAAAHLAAAEWTATTPDGDVFNLGTGTGSSVLDVIRAAEAATGRKIPYEVAPRRAGDTARLVAGARKARDVLGWRPQLGDLETIVASAWAWHRSHPDGYGGGS